MYYTNSARICARTINDEEIFNRMNDIARDFNQYHADIGSAVRMRVVATVRGPLLEKYDKMAAQMKWVGEQLADMLNKGGSFFDSRPDLRYTEVKVPTGNKFQPYKIYRAYCSPNDKYRRDIGEAVAWARSQGREIPEFI